MTTTARGGARRAALVDAAAALVAAQGFGAVSHRAVAARARFPLAATTYYFSSLDDLLVQAVDQLAGQYVEQASATVGRLPSRPVGAAAAARRVVDVVLPPEADAAALLGLYERYLQAARTPALRPVVARWNAAVRELVRTVLERSGHAADPALALALVDGLAVTALAEGHDPRRTAVHGLRRLLADGPAT